MSKNKSSLERILIVVILSGLVGVSYFAYDLYKKILKINTIFGDGIIEQYINIESDDNFTDVISLLESKNLLFDINSFKWVAYKKNYINHIKAGRYFINKNMNNNDLVNLLLIQIFLKKIILTRKILFLYLFLTPTNFIGTLRPKSFVKEC